MSLYTKLFVYKETVELIQPVCVCVIIYNFRMEQFSGAVFFLSACWDFLVNNLGTAVILHLFKDPEIKTDLFKKKKLFNFLSSCP